MATKAKIFIIVVIKCRNNSGLYNNSKALPITATIIERFIIHNTLLRALVTK
jgi:hypothetical protein